MMQDAGRSEAEIPYHRLKGDDRECLILDDLWECWSTGILECWSNGKIEISL